MPQGREPRANRGTQLRLQVLAIAMATSLAVACESDPTGPVVELGDSVSLPDTLFDGAGYMWDVGASGEITNGSNDAYDSGLSVAIDGAPIGPFGTARAFEGGREVRVGPDTLSGLEVTRRVYVSPDRAFARYLDVLVNRGTAEASAQVTIISDLGSDAGTVVASTSDGDASVESTDRWIVTDDAADGAGDPTLAFVFAGPGAALPAASVTRALDIVTQVFAVSVPAGGRVILMSLASQNPNRDAAIRNAVALSALGVVGVLNGMSPADLAEVANWDLTP